MLFCSCSKIECRTIKSCKCYRFGTAAEQDAATMREAKFLQRELQEVIVAMILQGCTEVCMYVHDAIDISQ